MRSRTHIKVPIEEFSSSIPLASLFPSVRVIALTVNSICSGYQYDGKNSFSTSHSDDDGGEKCVYMTSFQMSQTA